MARTYIVAANHRGAIRCCTMRRYPESDTVVRTLVVTLVVLSCAMAFVWWRSYSQDREARRNAMPGCVARLGSVEACEAHFDEHHRQCFNYTNKPAGKFTPRQFDTAGYLDCIVQGAEPWAAAGRAAKAAQRRRDQADGIPLR